MGRIPCPRLAQEEGRATIGLPQRQRARLMIRSWGFPVAVCCAAGALCAGGCALLWGSGAFMYLRLTPEGRMRLRATMYLRLTPEGRMPRRATMRGASGTPPRMQRLSATGCHRRSACPNRAARFAAENWELSTSNLVRSIAAGEILSLSPRLAIVWAVAWAPAWAPAIAIRRRVWAPAYRSVVEATPPGSPGATTRCTAATETRCPLSKIVPAHAYATRAVLSPTSAAKRRPAPKGAPGMYCGGHGVDGCRGALYQCSGYGELVLAWACQNGCHESDPGADDYCN
jgi:hypothetical protein